MKKMYWCNECKGWTRYPLRHITRGHGVAEWGKGRTIPTYATIGAVLVTAALVWLAGYAWGHHKPEGFEEVIIYEPCPTPMPEWHGERTEWEV